MSFPQCGQSAVTAGREVSAVQRKFLALVTGLCYCISTVQYPAQPVAEMPAYWLSHSTFTFTFNRQVPFCHHCRVSRVYSKVYIYTKTVQRYIVDQSLQSLVSVFLIYFILIFLFVKICHSPENDILHHIILLQL